LFPLPSATVVHALNKSSSVSPMPSCMVEQGLPGALHFCHYHLSRSALLNFINSEYSKPSIDFGLCTLFQLTMQ
jgi:hypothetical protein